MTSSATDLKFSVGAGLQYGIVGGQAALAHQESKYLVSRGLLSYSLGMQTIVSDNERHAVGFAVGKIGAIVTVIRFGIVTYNYHPNGFKNSGLTVGAGLGMMKSDLNEQNPALTLDIGYQF